MSNEPEHPYEHLTDDEFDEDPKLKDLLKNFPKQRTTDEEDWDKEPPMGREIL